MKLRYALWLFIALAVVGLWPAAAAPIGLAASGVSVILGAIPGPVLVLAAVVAWLKHRPTPTATA
jgi:hypothetical protein